MDVVSSIPAVPTYPICSLISHNNVEVICEGIDYYCLPRNGTISSVRVCGNIQLSDWPDQCFRAGANNPSIGSAQVRESHWVSRGSVSYGTDHWNHLLSSIRNEPKGWSKYKMFYNCADKGFSTKHTLVNGLSVLICGAPRDTDKPQGCYRPVPSNGAVNIEGTGVTRAGELIEYTGEVHSSNCPSVFGDASAISGASHKCLIPFISVACDISVLSLSK